MPKTTAKSRATRLGTDMFGRRINSKVGRLDVFIADMIKADKLEDITVNNLYKLCGGESDRSYIKRHLKALLAEDDYIMHRHNTMERVVEELTGDKMNVARIPNPTY